MIIDLSDIIKDYGGKIMVSGELLMENTEFLGEMFTFNEPLHIDANVTNNTKSLELKAKVSGSMTVHCARCTKPFSVPVDFNVRELLMKEDQCDSTNEDVVLFSGYELDMTDIIINSFLMNVPGKYICSENCKGLCQHCGANLNEGDCNCEQEDIDPRWKALADIMKKTSDTE